MGKIKIIAGLGNPGKRYEHTRHNAGFLLADFVKERFFPSLGWLKWKKGEFAAGPAGGGKIHIVKPMTYMNNSGPMLREFADYFKVQKSEMLVCFDDISLKFGSIRIRSRGSAGGHKGMLSVIERFGSPEIPRLRIGVGGPFFGDASDYVLGKFSREEMERLPRILEKSADAISSALEDGLEKAMSDFNGE